MTLNIRSCALVTRFADTRVAESAGLLAQHLASRGIAPLALDDEIDRFDGAKVSGVSEAELAARAGERGRALVEERYGWRRVALTMCDVYEEAARIQRGR